MTKVIVRMNCRLFLVFFLLSGITVLACGQAAPASATTTQGPAESLYLQLRSVGLDKSRVFRVRSVSLDQPGFHIALDDGTIAFTEDVAGHVTGAFFEGEGEVLLSPPNKVERASMALFTGAAILEERFFTAYFRFNDDTFTELQPQLRPAENAAEFITQWAGTARNLAQVDAMRLLTTFCELLPTDSPAAPQTPPREDRFWHARIQGKRLGIIDLSYDSLAAEQVWAGQTRTVQGETYFDILTSFSPSQSGNQGKLGDTTSSDTFVSLYKIRTEIKMPTQISADALLQLEVKKSGRRSTVFELSRFLQVKQVEADGKPVEFIHNQALEGTELARLGNDLIIVVFPQPLRAGQRVQLRFVYSGDVLSEAGGGLVYVGARGTWYPNRRPEVSNFDLEFRYPAEWTLVATGKRAENPPPDGNPNPSPDHAGEQTGRWISERPLPVAGFNLGKYERVIAHAGDVLVETYAAQNMEKAFPRAPLEVDTPSPLIPSNMRPAAKPAMLATAQPSPARNAGAVAETSARAIEFFARRYGPYPYSSLSLTQRPGIMSQGWPGLVFLSSFSFLSDAEKSDLQIDKVARTISSGVIAHETAHQWWGDLITWGSYRDQWLVEALADYSSLLLLETRDPSQFRAVLENYRNNLLEKNKNGEPLMSAGPVTLGNRLSSSHFPNGYEVISYERGVWLMHMLRNMLRDAERKSGPGTARSAAQDEPFVRVLRKIRERYEGRPIVTRDFLRAFEEELPRPLWHEGRKSLDWFNDGWINGSVVPRFELSGLKFEDKSGSSVVTGMILQKEAPDNLVTAIPIYSVAAGKTTLLGQVFADGRESPFRIVAPAGTRKVVLDSNHTLLSRAR